MSCASLPPVATPLDDRSPYEAAESVVRVIARHSPARLTEEAVWQMIYNGVGAHERPYVEAIRRTRHSIFYHQLQQLYEFGVRELPDIHRDAFCDAVGRDYTSHVLEELVPSLIQVALARDAGFQAATFDMIRLHLGRHAGNFYATSVEYSPRSIELTVSYARPDETAAYLRQYDLDPLVCFRNSFHFIAGAAQQFAAATVAGYDAGQFRLELGAGESRGHMSFPVGATSHFAFDQLIQTLMRYLREVEAGRLTALRETDLETSLITRSRVMQETWDRIRRASLSDEIVLLRGESGTGKSFFARRIHELSRRRDGPFIEVGLTSDVGSDNLIQSNLFGHERGAFTGATERKLGLFSLADGGTIFLDEIGDATPELQAKLLRVIEGQSFKRLGGVRDLHVNVRVIAATNHDLEQLVRQGRFREDLFYRINVIPLVLPPLRHRAEDIPSLAQFLLARASAGAFSLRKRLPPALAERLKSYPWPGNIRELEHALRHAVAMGNGDEIAAADFPPAVRAVLVTEASDPSDSPPPAGRVGEFPVINDRALRRAIRESDPIAIGSSDHPEDFAAHIAHARRAYLSALIDELHGDLALIALFWDHGSEKTLRKTARQLRLTDRLAVARRRGA